MGLINKIILLISLLQYSTIAKEIVVKSMEVELLRAKDFVKNSEESYSLHLEKLTLNDGAILLLSSDFTNKIVNIKIDDLIINGKGHIAQSLYSIATVIRHEGYFGLEQYLKQVPRAQKGNDGARVDFELPEKGGGDKGRDGNHGTNGKAGRHSLKELNLDININSFGKLDVVLIAESGGNGGNGSAGQGGSKPECDRNRGGDGGHGGNGGQGGSPGRVGDVNIKWQSDLPLITTGDTPLSLNVRQIPGLAGQPGLGGAGGPNGGSIGCVLWRRSGGTPGRPGKLGDALYEKGDYFILGSTGEVKIQKKDAL